MNLREFSKVGHWPTLLCAFLYFDISFMVWVLLGPLAPAIIQDLGLSDFEKGLLVAVPLLGGALLRLVLGILTDMCGARVTAIFGLIATVIPLLLGWLWAETFAQLLVVGLLLGVAGASFAAALPLASRWYPPHYQGLALGIAGAGNSGTALATFFAPRLANAVGWHRVFGLALIPVLATFCLVALVARESPDRPPAKRLSEYGKVLAFGDTWWFCFFYCVTFGGFVGLASFLNTFFNEQFGLSKVTAGTFATMCVIAGSFFRPVGGYIADRLGGLRLLVGIYAGVGLCMLGLSTAHQQFTVASLLLCVVMGLLGMGNGAVFQLVPQRFPREMGVVTGVIGAAGGIGGFFLPTFLGGVKELSGSFQFGFVGFACLAFICLACVIYVGRIQVPHVVLPLGICSQLDNNGTRMNADFADTRGSDL
jgi:NNP family nitrate/nitrite transporter-like MFS transporter